VEIGQTQFLNFCFAHLHPIHTTMSSARSHLACLTALQIWDTELGPLQENETITPEVIVPKQVHDLLADIIHAVRACLEAFRNQGIRTHD